VGIGRVLGRAGCSTITVPIMYIALKTSTDLRTDSERAEENKTEQGKAYRTSDWAGAVSELT